MASSAAARLEIGHPSPERDKVSMPVLAFALAGGPVAFMLQLLIGFAFASYVCLPSRPGALPSGPPGWLVWTITAANVIALAVATLALATGIVLTRRTKHEHRHASAGMLDAGEGRTRFLAVWGVFTSLLFLLAIGSNTLSLFLVPLCRV